MAPVLIFPPQCSVARQLGLPMHSQPDNHDGEFKLKSLNSAPILLLNPVMSLRMDGQFFRMQDYLTCKVNLQCIKQHLDSDQPCVESIAWEDRQKFDKDQISRSTYWCRSLPWKDLDPWVVLDQSEDQIKRSPAGSRIFYKLNPFRHKCFIAHSLIYGQLYFLFNHFGSPCRLDYNDVPILWHSYDWDKNDLPSSRSKTKRSRSKIKIIEVI